jgi:membrane fusion protein (multidrug efflux system)
MAEGLGAASVMVYEADSMKLRRFVYMAVWTASLAAWGCSSSNREPGAEPSAGTSALPQPPATLPTTSPGHLDRLEILTVLSVERSVDLLAQRDGVIAEVNSDQDSWVEKDAILARMDDRELQAKLERTRLDLEVTENNLKYQQAERKAKEAAYRRQQELRKFGLSSEAALEEAEFHSTGAAFDEKSWEANVKAKKAEIHELEVDLEKTRFIAPFSAYVVRRSVRAGQNVIKNDPCFRLSQLSPLQVHFLVPESAGARPKAGDALKVVVIEDGAREVDARVQRVSPTIDAASGSYDVTAQLTGGGLGQLRPGMAVKVLWPSRRSKPSS